MSTEPLQVEWIPGRVGDGRGHRMMVILSAPGCAYACAQGGCTNCSFPQSFGLRHEVSAGEYDAQLGSALERIPADDRGPVQVDLFVSGSFFNPDEVPPAGQRLLLERAARAPRIERVAVETRPEYVTAKKIKNAVAAAQPLELEVAIGLESADRVIREQRIRKGFTWRDFEKAVQQLAGSGASMLVYLLLKPIATGEAEAIEDLVDSAGRVFDLVEDLGLPTRIGLEPCFVGPDTELERAFEADEYRPPWLWSVVEVVRRIAPRGPVQVGLSDEGRNPQRAAHNCDRCSVRVREALATFNLDRESGPLTELSCNCRADWMRVLER